MGYCARCGEISSSDKCQKCRGRSVASIATALDTIGRSSEGNSIRENILGERGHSKAGVTGPFPQTSNSTPVIPSGLNRRQCSSFTADQPPLSPSWAKPISKRQGAPASLRDIQPRDISEFINNNNKEPPFVTTSPTSVVPTALVENASNIQTARSGLLKSSTRNSSFFLKNANDSSRNENLTTLSSVGGIMSGSYSTTTTKPRPRLSTQLFHYDSANSSTMNSPATPVSPYNGNLMAHLSTKLAAPATTISDNGQSPRIIPKTKDQQLEEKQPNNINNINNDTVASNKKENNEQLTQQTKKKKKKICCKCNQPFGRSDGKGTRRRIGVPLSNGSQDDYAWYHYDCLRCPICNEQFTKHDYFVCHGQEVYHARCRKLLLKQNNDTTNNTDYLQEESDSSKSKCTVCSTSIKVGSDGNGFEYEGNNYYHFQCAFVCFSCQKMLTIPESQRKQIEGKVFCYDCYLTVDKNENKNHKQSTSKSKSPPVSTPRRRRCVSSSAIALTSSSEIEDTSPSELFRNRTKALPKLGGSTMCPRCKRSVSVHDDTRGPRARRWHKACLACASCAKRMDSDAKVYENERGEWLVYCRGCTDKRRRSSYYMD